MSLPAAGAFLLAASARNWVRQVLRKLRQPRYLVGAAALAFYFYSFFLRGQAHRFFLNGLHGRPAPTPLPQPTASTLWLLLALALTVVGALAVFSSWTLGKDRLSFSFNEAEVTWLLTGPVRRRSVVRYKVCVGLLRTLLSALLVSLLFRRGLATAVLPLMLATSLSFAVVWLHSALASLLRVGWHQAGTSGRWRALVGVLVVAGCALAGALSLHAAGPPPSLELDDKAFVAQGSAWLVALTSARPLCWALVPARALFACYQAQSLGQALGPLAVLALLCALLLVALLLLDVPLEEAALASAERRARLQAGRRRRGAALPRASRLMRLSGSGAPEVALAWKNWAALRRMYGANLGLLFGSVGLGAGLFAWAMLLKNHAGDGRLLVAAAALIFAAFTFFVGPLSTRTDLRADLRRLDVLRTLPLSGLQVVRGELLAPALLLGGTEVALLVLAFGLSAGSRLEGFPLLARAGWAAGAALLLPTATAAFLVVQNAAALVFPSLLVDDEERSPRGVEATGTRLINLLASLLLLVVGFAPALVLGLAVGLGCLWAGAGPLAPTLGCAAAAAVLGGEMYLALGWMGRGLERLDPTTA
ncbi:MAG: putative ABC exporter domain-containing protein [Myxococcaceae bacterium]